MSFWQNVESEREYRNISRKELAQKANFAVSGISLGLAHNSMPSVDVAVRIARVLGVSVEYLVTSSAGAAAPSATPRMNRLISDLNRLDDYDLDSISALVHRIAYKAV